HNRGIPLSSLMRCQFVLACCLQKKLTTIYELEQRKVYQTILFDEPAQSSVSFDSGSKFFDGVFAGVRPYRGRQKFPRHYTGGDQVPFIDGKGEDGGDGQKFQCAVTLDSQKGVRHWIRDVPRHPNAFRLPVAWGRFYPELVAELEDGRVLVVEFKGKHLKHDPKEVTKGQVRKRWENVVSLCS
ncbi:MAG: restriction endonuclease subunit R, partial [Planktotalea sp.]